MPTVSYMTCLVRQLGVDTAYVLGGFPLAIISFVVLITGFSLSMGLAVLVIGIPVLTGTMFIARGLADLERIQLPAILHRPRVRPVYKVAPTGAGVWRRILTPLGDAQSWLDFTHGVLKLIPSTVAFSFVVTWWSGTLAGCLYWAYDWALPHPEDNNELHELLGLADTAQNRILFNSAVGLFFVLTLPLVVRGSALAKAWFAGGMLTGVAALRGQITDLERRRAAAVSAEATALRRLERDIHDGPQQRLVLLAMELSRAQQQVDSDPDAARATLAGALTQTRETLGELRALSRGIAPPVLTDRGLPSALAALGGRCTVPVDLAIDPALPRLDPAIEHTAYFVVAEALTNVAKHSQATGCWVTVTRVDGRLDVVVIDDGLGGAGLAKGHGLAGLADRVRANGGTFTVTSPIGGPTEVRAELPC